MRRASWEWLVALASAERGALLWVPGLVLAVAVTLFAMRVAPAGVSLFTRTTSLRIVLGPCVSEPASPAESARFVAVLRRSLARRGEMSLVDSLKVARLVSSRAAVEGSGSLLHVVRPLNPHLALTPELRRASGLWRARVVAWDVRSERQVFVVEAAAIQPAVLGRAVAESLVVALGRPHPGSVDPQASEAGLRASSTER